MPKYCIEFVADVCTLPSQDNSDCSDSREQDPSTVNSVTELNRELRLTHFIVPEFNNESLLCQKKSKPIFRSTEFLPKSSNLHCNVHQDLDHFPKKRINREDYTNSHVTPMGNTACCLLDSTRAAWDESDHRIATMRRFTQDTVPIHRTFVVSRAVQCGDSNISEQTMCNNHSYHESSYLCTHVTKTANNRGSKLISCSMHQPNEFGNVPINNRKQLHNNLSAHALAMVTSNSEISVDVSSLSAQRCSSVTPPTKTSICHSQGTEKDQIPSNILLQEDDMDSLSATISAGSISNIRENSKRHRKRPAPYTRPKPKIYNDSSRRTSSTIPTDWLEFKQKGNKRPETSLYHMLGVSAFGDSLIQTSSRSALENSSSGRATQRYETVEQMESNFPTNKAEPLVKMETSTSRVDVMLGNKSLVGSSSTLGDTSSVSSLDQPQTAKLVNSNSDQPQSRPHQETINEQHNFTKQTHIQRDSAINKSLKCFADETCTLSKVPRNSMDKQDGAKFQASSIILSKTEDTKGKLRANNDPSKKSLSHINLSKTKSSAYQALNQLQSNAIKNPTVGVESSNAEKRLSLKVRSLSESRIPTTQAFRTSRLNAVSKKELESTLEKSEKLGVQRSDTSTHYQDSHVDKQENLPTTEKINVKAEAPAKLESVPEQRTKKPDIQDLHRPVDTEMQKSQGQLVERTSTLDILHPTELAKPVRRQCSFSSNLTSNTKIANKCSVPIELQPNTHLKSQEPANRLLNATSDRATRSETNMNANSGLNTQRPATSPSFERADRRSAMAKRYSAPIPLKLPQANRLLTPTDTTGTPTSINTTNNIIKDGSTMLSSPSTTSVGRGRLDESIMSVPLHVYTPQAGTRVKLVRHKFFIPESANIEAILADPDDRRIKAICERYKCDVEIYSKLPWCGFLQYIIVLAARDAATLRRCARTLDSRLNWCLDAQIR